MNILKKTFIQALAFACLFLSVNSKANECGYFFDNLTAPLCTDAKYIFWTGAALTATVYYSKYNFSDRARSATLRNKPLDRWSKVGEIIGWGYLNGAYFFGSLIAGGSQNRKNAETMAEASGYTLGMTLLLKESVQEQRPDGSDEWDSFPSGHTSMAFAFASVVTANHGWAWGLGSHLIAGFIGYSRIHDDRHYLHDVLAGATLGMSYGWGIHLNHKKHKKPYWLAVVPTPDMQGMRFALGGTF